MAATVRWSISKNVAASDRRAPEVEFFRGRDALEHPFPLIQCHSDSATFPGVSSGVSWFCFLVRFSACRCLEWVCGLVVETRVLIEVCAVLLLSAFCCLFEAEEIRRP